MPRPTKLRTLRQHPLHQQPPPHRHLGRKNSTNPATQERRPHEPKTANLPSLQHHRARR
nr:MAG TPA: hypothetical protein [Caudoviricetes sp.]